MKVERSGGTQALPCSGDTELLAKPCPAKARTSAREIPTFDLML
jgi:hypothetical protein